MARKKDKKKNKGKKDPKKQKLKKKAILKMKLLKKKDKKKASKKKELQKKAAKKKDVKKKEAGKKNKILKNKPLIAETTKIKADTLNDHSSNYNVREAVIKLRSLSSLEQVQEFTKGEQRVSVTRSIQAVINRLR